MRCFSQDEDREAQDDMQKSKMDAVVVIIGCGPVCPKPHLSPLLIIA